MDKKCKIRFEIPVSALERWDESIRAAKDDGVHIDIYSTVGEYGDGDGITAKKVSEILKEADGKDVVVNINSGGGDFFEGLAIHSLLANYEGKVSVRILGLAASAASIVAMAGDNIEVAKSGFLMIHNSWTVAIGNKDDLQTVVGMLTRFDASMVALYATKTGKPHDEISKMMADETWIAGEIAVEMGFAHSILDKEEVKNTGKTSGASAKKKIDVELAKAGMPRTERRALIKQLSGTQDATEVTRNADAELVNALRGLLSTIQQ